MNTNPFHFIAELKTAILKSRYVAARLANKELLSLYFYVGYRISQESKFQAWGSKVLQQISDKLRAELEGLRGFSPENLKKMRVFADFWISRSMNSDHNTTSSGQNPDNLNADLIGHTQFLQEQIGSMVSNQFTENFFSIGFSHHYAIASGSASLEEALFYIEGAAKEFWSYQTLLLHIRSGLFNQIGHLPNNFRTTLISDFGNKAIRVFKDEYLFDFIHIESDNSDDERLIESEITQNIKQFILALGNGFAFIGNQFRLVVEEHEFFIDLLFFNRHLQALVAIELKTGNFRPEYLGKMNFYLSALDDLVKLPGENPSIGIILCKEKTNSIVEYSFRDFSKPMGVATYMTSNKLPDELKGVLPDPERLKELLFKENDL